MRQLNSRDLPTIGAFLFGTLLLSAPLLARANEGGRLPVDFKTIGDASLRVAMFRIYDARLTSPSGQYQPNKEPLMLTLTYQRDIHRDKLIEKTQQQLARQLDSEALNAATIKLRNLWPNVSQGDRLAFLLNPDGHGSFFFNGEHLGELQQPHFNRAFMNIWLGEDSSYPKLARKLRGEQ